MTEQMDFPGSGLINLLHNWSSSEKIPAVICPKCGENVSLFGTMDNKIVILCNCGFEWFEQ